MGLDAPVNTANLATKSELSAVNAKVPNPSTQVPPGVNDSGAVGTESTLYALANHTHPSKVRKARVTTAADGTYTWNYTDAQGNPMPFDTGVIPIVQCIAETGVGVTDVFNAQIEGTPTNTSVKIRVARTQRSVVALIGLTILSIPASVGATPIHIIATAP